MRIEQFNDNETEQVWELFKNEFQNASRQLDGELGWMLVSGELSIEDINKQVPKEIVAKLVADVAMSASSTVPSSASWISNGDLTGGQLTDAVTKMNPSKARLQKFHERMVQIVKT